jgi:hypothetical protein
MKKTYIITKDVDVPVVSSGGSAHRQAQIRMRRFRKGQLVQGELKHSNNKPSFILVGRMLVIPVECVKEIQGKDVTSKFSGTTEASTSTNSSKQPVVQTKQSTNVKYLDALLIGAVIGFGAMYFAEKKGWVVSEDSKMKLYGALGGGLLGMYLVYRNRATNTTAKVIVKQQQA